MTARQRVLHLTLVTTCSLGIVASTIYVPSIPAIAQALGASVARVQFTFVGYLLAFAASMPVLGTVSDRYGRKRTMIFGVALGVLGSAVCAASPNIESLIFGRIIQGIGFSGGMVVGRAIVRDLYDRDGAAQIIAGLSIAITLAQAFAPIPGGYLQEWVGWRANFTAVGLLAAAALLLVIRFVPELRPADGASRQGAGVVLRNMRAGYRALIGTRRFVGYALTATGAHAGFHIFAAGAPAVLITGLGISPEHYGYYASLPPLGFIIGSFVSNRITRRLGVDALIAMGSALLVPAGCVMVVLALLHATSPYAIVGPMVVICCASGLITPNAVAGSLSVNVGIIGAASGLASFMQMTGAAAATAALSLGGSGNPLLLAIVIAAAGLFAVTAFGSLTRFGRPPAKVVSSAQASV
ncbi:MAG: multidrug effflux MFS transporter [Alphaproteobacteria bacterium]|nr:multidrug effflux MFS transporter [Alphaproteobacteria bacterium]